MKPEFPIPTPRRLPSQITPCPIVEAVLEIRFVTSEPWRTMPGLFFTKIRERYPQQKDLPLAQLSEEFRRQDPSLIYMPLLQFLSKDFIVQFGPRVVSLITHPSHYPGWSAVEKEMKWLLERVQQSGIITEGERLGVRYIDFFDFDIFSKLILKVEVADHPVGGELAVNTVLRRGQFVARIQVSNSVILGGQNETKRGSVLDVDVWLGSLDFDLFANATSKFGEAHQFVKEIFFGLLKSEFLATLSPEYP
ncbi:MAG: TIGR04255 family protein [Verrucomicrobia bacterium]|nr:TIGR04255 family protein [Verrucomicrobiota bacterium]